MVDEPAVQSNMLQYYFIEQAVTAHLDKIKIVTIGN